MNTPRMSILVTGGAGFIGSAVVRRLISETDHAVVNVDALTYAASPEALASVRDDPRYTFEELDVRDAHGLRVVFDAHAPYAVLHHAAESHVDRSIDAPAEFLGTNVQGTFTLLPGGLRAVGDPDRGVYAELGFEDSAGIDEDAGLLAGLFLPRVGGLSSTSLRWEYTAFGDALCFTDGCLASDRSWFLHPRSKRLDIAPDGTLLGHPLGGCGWEHRAEVMVWPAASPFRATVTGTVRSREPYNILYDDGATAYIGALALDWWPAPGWEAGARLEAGERAALELRVAVRGLGGR